MFRNQYDTDVTTWSPQGRLHQVEYAMEAVKQGSCVVGIASKTGAVLATLRRSPSELSSHHQKIYKIDDHVGVGLSGLTGDARVLSKHMRTECLDHKYVFEGSLPVSRLVQSISDRSQTHTQMSWKRPFGVGLLVIGYDQTGSHLFQTCPSGNYFEYKAMAIGARAQSAKTYLERHVAEFENATEDQLIKHALMALKESSQDELTSGNTAFAVVGENRAFTIFSDDDARPHLDLFDPDAPASGGDAMET
eukprot:GFYU01001764.1.p1 GENE.GFYU01001764.1~~GFYU01001764.1.p1  ORF type:complete len:249 (+),score=56.44 GFYU01001764.1:34-780(+)